MNFIELFVGVGLGWFVSHLENGYRDWRTRKLQMEEFERIMNFNLDRMKQMRDELAEGVLPTYRLDLTVADFLISKGESLFKTTCQFKGFNWCRNQMHHINCKLDTLFSLQNNPIYAQFHSDVLSHLHGEIESIKRLLDGGCKCS